VWLKAHPFAADAFLAAGLTVLAVPGLWLTAEVSNVDYRNPDVWGVLLVLFQTVPLAWRRRYPTSVLAVTGAAVTIATAANYPGTGGTLGPLIAIYTMAAHCPRRRSIRAAAVTGAAVVFALLMAREQVTPDSFIGNLVIYATAWTLGDNLKTRRERTTALEERAAQLETERETNARRAVAEERARIARELHDSVAHSVSVMVVQAGGARRLVATNPERAAEALGQIELTGRQALVEMRRLLGVLRTEDEAPSLAPQPSIAEVDALVASVRDAGVPVELTVEGEPRALPRGLDLSAYRIVQEALTNILKHAGPAAAKVVLRWSSDELFLHVIDNGRGASVDHDDRGDGAGHGLVGMRERVALYGGELRAGPSPGGGYHVAARLPLSA
jgi:signal transduction histidine kinase